MVIIVILLLSVPVNGYAKTSQYTDVKVNKKWVITFSTSIDPKSVTSNNIYMINNSTNKKIGITLSKSGERKIVIKPKSNLDYSTQYTIYAKNIKSVNGKKQKSVVISFTTETPEVVSVELKEIELAYGSKFDGVNKSDNLNVVLNMKDGTKRQAKVRYWSIPENFTSMIITEYDLEGDIIGYNMKAQAHLKIVNSSGETNSNNADNSSKIAYDKTLLGDVPDMYEENFGYNIAKELADSKYKGRLAGTDSYNAAAMYVSSVFEELGLARAGNNDSYLQKFTMNTAQYKTVPELSLNGSRLVFLEDFKVHATQEPEILIVIKWFLLEMDMKKIMPV